MTETSDNYSGVDREYYDREKRQLKSEVFIHMEKEKEFIKNIIKMDNYIKK
jgi:hypothetical protein